MQNFKRPKAVMCHICGREFGTASISIHIPQCEKKWIDQESQKPKNQRRPVPKAPQAQLKGTSQQELDAYNKQMGEAFEQQAMEQCPNCARTFLSDRLAVHLRSCRPDRVLNPLKKNGQVQQASEEAKSKKKQMSQTARPSAPKEKVIQRPKAIMCHICGREFGTASISIHIPQCEKKWIDRENLKPKNERKPVPKAPEVQLKGTSMEQLDEYNRQMGEVFEQQAMDACPNCGRTFLSDRLPVHLRSCRPDRVLNPLKKNGEIQKPTEEAKNKQMSQTARPSAPKEKVIQRPKAIMCHICGREFGTASISIHIPQCEKKWIDRENLKPKNERKPVPKAPEVQLKGTSMDQLDEYNRQMGEVFEQQAMDACPNCGRTFLSDRLPVHLRSCRPDRVLNPLKKNGEIQKPTEEAKNKQMSQTARPSVPKEKVIQRPKVVMCHICGREFGTASISIHIPQCEKKWIDRENLKPKNERKPVPKAPEVQLKGTSMDQLDEYNRQMGEVFEQQAMDACPNCGRTFLSDRLPVHLRSCRPDRVLNPLKKKQEEDKNEPEPTNSKPSGLSKTQQVPAQQVQQSEEIQPPKVSYNLDQVEEQKDNQNYVSCSKCNRNFFADRIVKHEKVCKGPAPTVSKTVQQKQPQPKAKKEMPEWKKQHLDFVNNIKYAKKIKQAQAEGRDIREVEAPKQFSDPYAHYIQCQYCGRKYAPDVAERHIPRCATIINKPKAPPGQRQTPSQTNTVRPSTKRMGQSAGSYSSQKSIKQTPARNGLGSENNLRTGASFKCQSCNRMIPQVQKIQHMNQCVSKIPSVSNITSPYKLTSSGPKKTGSSG